MANNGTDLSVGIGADITDLQQGLQQAEAELQQFFEVVKELKKVGEEFKQLGTKLTVGLTVPIVGLATAALYANKETKAAFKSLSDSVSGAMGRVGEVINKNLNITGLLDKIAGFIDKVVTAFENLSPAMQNTIFVVAGLLAAVGPLLAGFGTLLTLIGPLITAIGFLTTPVGLLAVALAAVVIAVTANWGKIKPYIIDTINYFIDLYNESIIVRAGVEGLVAGFKNTFSVIKNLLIGVYEIFKSFAKATVSIFSGVGDVIKGALTFDFALIGGGINKVAGSYKTLFTDIKTDSLNASKAVIEDFTKNGAAMINNTLNGKKARITDITFDFGKGSSTKAADKIKKGVKNSLKTTPPVEIDLENIVAIKPPKLAGLIGAFGKEFKTVMELQDFQKTIDEQINQPFISMVSGAEAAAIKMNAFWSEFATNFNADFSDLIGGSIEGSIGDLFDSIGNAIGQGGSVIGAIGASLLGSLGGFLSELGGMLIKYGLLAITKGKLDLAILTGGPVSIAAGIAAVAVGALLKVAGSAIGSFASGGGGGSVSTSGGNSSYSSPTSNYSSNSGQNNEFVFRISGNDLLAVTERARDRNARIN